MQKIFEVAMRSKSEKKKLLNYIKEDSALNCELTNTNVFTSALRSWKGGKVVKNSTSKKDISFSKYMWN